MSQETCINSSIRSPDWKYIRNDRSSGAQLPPPGEELYFLRTDSAESLNLAADNPGFGLAAIWKILPVRTSKDLCFHSLTG